MQNLKFNKTNSGWRRSVLGGVRHPWQRGEVKTGRISTLAGNRFLAHRSQTLVQKTQFRYQVTPASGFELRRIAHPDLLSNTVYRSYQFDFVDREAEILQYTARRQRIDMDIYLAHGIPQLKFEEDI